MFTSFQSILNYHNLVATMITIFIITSIAVALLHKSKTWINPLENKNEMCGSQYIYTLKLSDKTLKIKQ